MIVLMSKVMRCRWC